MAAIRIALPGVLAAALSAVCLAGSAVASPDPFTGAWIATDPFDGSTLRLQVGSPSAEGLRQVTLTDGFASACGAPATAIGTGTVSGSTLTTTVDIRCGGELRAEHVTIVYQLSGGMLTDGFSTFRPVVAADPFTGAWTATDPFDASTLRLQIGSPSAAGIRQVTLTDNFASACRAPATASGTGTVSGSTLTTTVDIRCGGELRAEHVTIVYQLSGGMLTDGFSTFRPTAA